MLRGSLSVLKHPELAILQGDNWPAQLAFCWLAHKRLSIKPIPITVTHLTANVLHSKPLSILETASHEMARRQQEIVWRLQHPALPT
jgi:hypothetical protein